ncbi:MAG: tetratricopeptide repeat protein [Akkermansiaceae bacterium]|nr:tetratricopeptide repeat protein [Akkermansiaceae bacterium]
MNYYLSPRFVVTAICASSFVSITPLWAETKSPQKSAAIEKSKAAPSLKILDKFPAPDTNTITGKALRIAILKTQAAPENAENWTAVGDLLAQLQRDTGETKYFDFAESAYQESLKIRPDFVAAMTGIAWANGGRHDFKASIEWAKKAITQDADCVAAYGIIGDAEVELGEYDSALDHYQKMMDLRPDLSSWSRGAHLLWIMGDKSKALWLMNKAINAGAPFAENTAWCRARLATMLFHDGAILPAQNSIQKLIDQKTKNVHVLTIAAKIATAQKDYALAMAHYETILSTGSNQAAIAAIGDLYALQGKKEEAEKFYAKLEHLHEHHHHGEGEHDHHFLAKFYANHDRNLTDALAMIKGHDDTKNVQEADMLAWIYYKNGKLPQAISMMKKALRYNTPDAEVHYHAGMIAAAHGDFTSAHKHLHQALQMNPHFNPLQLPALQKALDEMEQKKTISQTEK